MNVCWWCPGCNVHGGVPCQDLDGRSCFPEGGILARAEAAYACIESQKATGSLHAHIQVFIQCLHQHTPLDEVLQRLQTKGNKEINGYLKFKEHVCRQVYADPDRADERLPLKEQEWPEYVSDVRLTSRPTYLSQRISGPLQESKKIEEGAAWLSKHLSEHVQELQESKQHHVHLPNDKGERVPLTHCKRADNPTKCKSDFPRTSWLIDRAVVLCQGLLERMQMAVTGRRSKLGSLHGPMNHENLNGTSSAMLAVQQFNSDVQIPYRLPICEETHAACCENACWQVKDTQTMVQACQAGQDAQAGYACDYCAKRQPMAFNEIKECCKGHQSLNESIKDEKIGYVGKRHATRFMSDAYGKGIVRGQVENMNLRAYTDWSDVTSAETLSTAPSIAFFGSEFLKMVERLNDGADKVATALFPEVDKRNPQKRKVTLRDVATLYGQRPNHSDVWHLSPYEFTMYWKPVLATYPLSLDDLDAEHYHAALTDRGKQKLKNKDTNMQPGHDYEVKKGGFDWLAFPKVPSTQFFRNTWVLQRRRRPEVPTFFGAPIPRHHAGEHQRAAAIVMTYFHPWTLRKQDADEDVTYAGALRPNGQTWQEAMEEWFDGRVVCKEAKQYVGNF